MKAVIVLLTLLLTTGCSSPGGAPDRKPASPAGKAEAPGHAAIRQAARPVTGQTGDYDPLLEMIGGARFVLLGEQTHGTHEFYRERARITRELITEKGFSAVAVEADWPDAYRVNRFVRGLGSDATAGQALAGFTEFPRWMWGNEDVRDLVAWMREHNRPLPAGSRVGFYGLDLYSLWRSVEAVVASLERVDPAAAQRARQRYRCFEGHRKDPQAYGQAAASRPSRSCQGQAVEQLRELEQKVAAETPRSDPARREELFSAVQNARVVKGGEEYYRRLYSQRGLSSWNLRDRHMSDTLDHLAAFLGAQGKPPKVVVWAHNTHLGDARVTQMGEEGGEWNVGQLMRQRHGADAVLVGFTTYTGTVLAASQWGDQPRVKRVRPALPESFSALFHETGLGNFLLLLRGNRELGQLFGEPRLERAIGVIYLPQRERAMHYFQARLSRQFDAVIHFDETRALAPLSAQPARPEGTGGTGGTGDS